MKRSVLASTAAIFLALGSTAAWADCQEELAQLTGGVSKDGSLAPLESAAGAVGQADHAEGAGATGQAGHGAEGAAAEGSAAGDGEVSKDGSTEPLEADPQIATSGQDVAAQQEGGETAAQQANQGAGGSGDGSGRQAALDRAHAALAAGDEEACMAAVEEARAM